MPRRNSSAPRKSTGPALPLNREGQGRERFSRVYAVERGIPFKTYFPHRNLAESTTPEGVYAKR